MQESKFDVFSFKGKTRILHLTWFAFFLTFLVWFNHAPLLIAIKDSMGFVRPADQNTADPECGAHHSCPNHHRHAG